MGKCQGCKSDFKFQVFTSRELFSLKLSADFIDHLCERLKLDFDETTANGNVCFADSREVRADFRTSFNKLDIINFIAREHPERKTYFSTTEFSLPEDALSFWSAIRKT